MRWASGFATGVVALICAELLAWGVVIAPSYRDTYREFQAELPTATRVAVSTAWIFGLAAALAVAAAALNRSGRWSERSRVVALSALAIAAIGLSIGTAYAAGYPVSQLAGNISAG